MRPIPGNPGIPGNPRKNRTREPYSVLCDSEEMILATAVIIEERMHMTGEQYSREEDFHGKNIPSNHFVEAAVEIYQTDVMTDDQYNAWQASLA